MAIKKIAILGAGNGGCATAADLTLRGFEVRLFSRSHKTLLPIMKRGEITLVENGAEKPAGIYFVSPLIIPVVKGADLIVVAAPAVAHEYLARQMAPHLADGQIILLNPGHTGGSLHFWDLLRSSGCEVDFKLCETVTLTYICRMPEPARVEVYRRTTNLRCAAFPGKQTTELVRDVGAVFPNLLAAENVLDTGLSNINAIMHPAGMLGNAGWIEKTAGDFLYYREGITPAIAAWIEAVDRERLEIIRCLSLEPLRFIDHFHRYGLTSEDARSSGSVYRAIHESEPNRSIKSPSSLDHRYIREDIGYGLVPMAEIGRMFGVKTPVMDALITLASTALGVDFRSTGLTLERMGLKSIKPEGLLQILRDGFRAPGGYA
ncbi:MAG TPA: NAD/NADP octopine/nopaline dehydrogenase family protein [Candidatus Binatia bacterium]|nr:NAD/NADP octopine/nopaline dehydrogenase family protein [Candidatus Binatia bacterium]